MNTDNFLIEEKDIEFAQNICKVIENSDIRNRAVADALASRIARSFFEDKTYDTDCDSGLHNIGQVLEDIDISDIYINGSYIDVRLYFNDEELSVPKAQFDKGLLPVAYMFIKVSPDLSGATVTGFIQPENINMSNVKGDYIAIGEGQLVSFYDIEPLLNYKEDAYDLNETDIFAFLENNLSDKQAFYKSLIASKDGRLRLAKAVKAQYAFNFISVNDLNNEAANNIENADSVDAFSDIALTSDDLMSVDEGDEIFDLEPEHDDVLLEEVDDVTDVFYEPSDISPLETIDNAVSGEQNNSDAIYDTEPVQPSELEDIDNLEPVAPEDLEIMNDLTSTDDTDDTDAMPVENMSNNALTDEISIDLNQDSDVDINENSEHEQGGFEFSTAVLRDSDNTEDDFEILTGEKHEDSSGSYHTEASDLSEEDSSEDLLNMLEADNASENQSAENVLNNETGDSKEENSTESENNSEQIAALFGTENETEQSSNMFYKKAKQKSSIMPLAITGLIVIAGAVGYFAYNNFAGQAPQDDENNIVADSVQPSEPKQQADAMPIESVETAAPDTDENEGTAESIPAIEQNLDASILVSNLKVDWEVPAGYASNTSARRYLVKLGKVIQLNLKTELLLLNKPPITNKIAVEIKYNDGAKKFEAVGITISSGEKSVDDLIMQTVNRALAMKLSANTDSFNNLQGNPVLIIHL